MKSDFDSLASKERLVTEIINNDEKAMLSYVEDLQTLAPLFDSKTELYKYLRKYAQTFELMNIAIIEITITDIRASQTDFFSLSFIPKVS